MTGRELLALLESYDPKPTDYFRHGADRIAKTLDFLPRASGRVLELGCDCHFSLSLSLTTEYEITPQNSHRPIAAAENVDEPTIIFKGPDTRRFDRVLFDVETERFPFDDDTFDGVLCCEVIEHLMHDPAWMILESRRVLRRGGWLLLTTPNLASYHAIRRGAMGIHPLEHSMYFNHEKYGRFPIQHTREYMFFEVTTILQELGFSIERATSFTLFPNERLNFLDRSFLVPFLMVYNALRLRHPKHLQWSKRQPHTFVLARKADSPRGRFPKGLYID